MESRFAGWFRTFLSIGNHILGTMAARLNVRSQKPTLEEIFVAVCDSRAQRPNVDREGSHSPRILVEPS